MHIKWMSKIRLELGEFDTSVLWLVLNYYSDTFVGAYAANYLQQKDQQKWDIRAAVERASSASAWTIGEIGAQAAIPWSDQIDSMQANTTWAETATDHANDQLDGETTIQGLKALRADETITHGLKEIPLDEKVSIALETPN